MATDNPLENLSQAEWETLVECLAAVELESQLLGASITFQERLPSNVRTVLGIIDVRMKSIHRLIEKALQHKEDNHGNV